jgi:hypothetical protein
VVAMTEKDRFNLAHSLLAEHRNDWGGSDPVDKIAGARYAVVVERSDDGWVLAAATPEAVAEIALSTYTGTEGYDEWISEVYSMETASQIDCIADVTVTVTLKNGTTETASATTADRVEGPRLDGSNPDWMAAFTEGREQGMDRDNARKYADRKISG